MSRPKQTTDSQDEGRKPASASFLQARRGLCHPGSGLGICRWLLPGSV